MSTFDIAFNKTVGIEGGFTDDPMDSGGATKYGITERVARANGYVGDMKDLPIPFAKAVYKKRYWDLLRLDDIEQFSIEIPLELFDTAVNCGVGVAATFLQQSLNVLNRQQQDYTDLTVDGGIGLRTVAALASFLQKRKDEGETVMLRVLNSLQGTYYVHLAERREKDERFVYGWFLNRVRID